LHGLGTICIDVMCALLVPSIANAIGCCLHMVCIQHYMECTSPLQIVCCCSLQRYTRSGEPRILNTPRPMVALHKVGGWMAKP
jgi:hypothetical protein